MKFLLSASAAVCICAVLTCAYAFPSPFTVETSKEAQTSSFDDYSANLQSVIPGYDFQYYTGAAIYVDSKRVYSKPTGAFTVYWRIYSDDAQTSGTLFSTLYEKENVDGVEILTPLEIHVQEISGLNKASMLSRPVAKTYFENSSPDKSYVIKAVILKKDSLKPSAISYSSDGKTDLYSTFYLDDKNAYYDKDGM